MWLFNIGYISDGSNSELRQTISQKIFVFILFQYVKHVNSFFYKSN